MSELVLMPEVEALGVAIKAILDRLDDPGESDESKAQYSRAMKTLKEMRVTSAIFYDE